MVNWGDRGEVLAAVAQKGYGLCYASDELKADREVVLAAVRQNPDALQHASAAVRDVLPVHMRVLALQRLAVAGAPPHRPIRLKSDAQ